MRWFPLVCLALLAACNNEPGFDERYDAAEKNILETAEEIDAELEDRGDSMNPDDQR